MLLSSDLIPESEVLRYVLMELQSVKMESFREEILPDNTGCLEGMVRTGSATQQRCQKWAIRLPLIASHANRPNAWAYEMDVMI